MKKTKQKKYISFYQHNIDDPVIIIFDTKKEALTEARSDVKDALGQAGADAEEIQEHLEAFDRDGRADINGCVIFASECEYRPGQKSCRKQRQC